MNKMKMPSTVVLYITYCFVCHGVTASIILHNDLMCSENSLDQMTMPAHFHGRRGITLHTDDVGFMSKCDTYAAKHASDTINSGSAFHHVSLTNAIETKVVIQVSLFDPSTAPLRFSMGGISIVLDQSGIRTYSEIRVGQSMAVLTNGTMKKRQIQELEFRIQKTNRLCVFTVVQYPEVRRVFHCPTKNTFHIHGDNLTLHHVFLQMDKKQVARWDFTIETQQNNAVCKSCPLGTSLETNTKLCKPCWTGLHANVDAHSKWWYDPPVQTNTGVLAEQNVPAPDWAVLSVDQKLVSTGILRHSDMQTNGNMILTDSKVKYAYDHVGWICMHHYETRVDFADCTNTQSHRVYIYNGENIVVLPLATTPSVLLTVHDVLQSTQWQIGDTVRFCKIPGFNTHMCVNPIVLTRQNVDTWSPVNINPVHSSLTRYNITTSSVDGFILL